MKKHWTFRLWKISFLIDKRAVKVFFAAAAILLLGFLVSTGAGEVMMSPIEVVKSMAGFGTDMNMLIISSFRMPRILVAILAGICLAAAGAILQGIIRNPLASPDIIGITGGASLAVVSFLAFFSDKNNALTVSIQWMPVASFLGALIVGFIVYALSWKGGASSFRLVLIGIGFSQLADSLTTLMMIKGPIHQAAQANTWITGTVYGATWQQVKIMLPVTIVLLLLTAAVVRTVNLQGLGDDLGTGAGSSVQRNRLLLLLLGTALTGTAVAFAGAIGFVGLMAPHIARRLVGSSFGAMLPVSAVIGAFLVMIADLAGRTLFSPLEIPAGVFTAAIGAPYFIYLLYKTRNT
ncbi:iron chelate uptake ABC transporter family permease subunit [Bacillus mangrovi]|uniref:Iron chelate uptake ABC transporter family permease subunit n=1 Tax=Metabacillus mangrovi TaxID=1491830 RepID=A0A7X2V4Y7_9BACI|nr:iron ABC transporter permease [Metabacillus mangrovi]MTH53910.1 iron chelate uptake ABC transporter family permease subunit [Metabacillus mangrovi]